MEMSRKPQLDSILNKQKILKKIAFLVKMAKIASFKPNHKFFSGGSELKNQINFYTEIFRNINFNENHRADSDFKKRPFSSHSIIDCGLK
jgi:hypothetical protein